MQRKFLTWIPVAFVVVVFLAWAPWLTQISAEARAITAFNQAWRFVADGCGTNCSGCGAVSSQRVPFGVLVTIEYACRPAGISPAEYCVCLGAEYCAQLASTLKQSCSRGSGLDGHVILLDILRRPI